MGRKTHKKFGADIPLNYGIKATTYLKIANVYKQGEKCYLEGVVRENIAIGLNNLS